MITLYKIDNLFWFNESTNKPNKKTFNQVLEAAQKWEIGNYEINWTSFFNGVITLDKDVNYLKHDNSYYFLYKDKVKNKNKNVITYLVEFDYWSNDVLTKEQINGDVNFTSNRELIEREWNWYTYPFNRTLIYEKDESNVVTYKLPLFLYNDNTHNNIVNFTSQSDDDANYVIDKYELPYTNKTKWVHIGEYWYLLATTDNFNYNTHNSKELASELDLSNIQKYQFSQSSLTRLIPLNLQIIEHNTQGSLNSKRPIETSIKTGLVDGSIKVIERNYQVTEGFYETYNYTSYKKEYLRGNRERKTFIHINKRNFKTPYPDSDDWNNTKWKKLFFNTFDNISFSSNNLTYNFLTQESEVVLDDGNKGFKVIDGKLYYYINKVHNTNFTYEGETFDIDNVNNVNVLYYNGTINLPYGFWKCTTFFETHQVGDLSYRTIYLTLVNKNNNKVVNYVFDNRQSNLNILQYQSLDINEKVRQNLDKIKYEQLELQKKALNTSFGLSLFSNVLGSIGSLITGGIATATSPILGASSLGSAIGSLGSSVANTVINNNIQKQQLLLQEKNYLINNIAQRERYINQIEQYNINTILAPYPEYLKYWELDNVYLYKSSMGFYDKFLEFDIINIGINLTTPQNVLLNLTQESGWYSFSNLYTTFDYKETLTLLNRVIKLI